MILYYAFAFLSIHVDARRSTLAAHHTVKSFTLPLSIDLIKVNRNIGAIYDIGICVCIHRTRVDIYLDMFSIVNESMMQKGYLDYRFWWCVVYSKSKFEF